VSVVFKASEVFDACRVLFGPDIHLSYEFLDYLQTSGARSAYRQRAKEVHPDLVNGEDESLREQHAQMFHQLAEAFEIVTGFLDTRLIAPTQPHTRPQGRQSSNAAAEEKTEPPKSRSSEDRSGYYRGGVPARPMEIGLYLYYRGAVGYRDLMEALLWQRKQRPSVGSIARRWGWLSSEQVQSVLLGAQVGRFGARAVDMDLLTPFQVQTLLYFQRCRQQRLGDYFVEQKILTAEQMDRLVAQLADHNRRFRSRDPQRHAQRAAS